MSLFLLEIDATTTSREEVSALIARASAAAEKAGSDLIEAQVTADLSRVYVVVEQVACEPFEATLRAAGVEYDSITPVRLLGADLEEVKAARRPGQFLVEWDLPEGLSLDAYLERKKAKAPLYAQVPEVSFLRTYVREDMEKCLCFYDAPDVPAVLRAREAVSAPVDRLYGLRAPATTEGKS